MPVPAPPRGCNSHPAGDHSIPFKCFVSRIFSFPGESPSPHLGLSDNLPNRFAVINLETLSPRDLQTIRVQPHQLKYGRVNIGDVVTILDRVKAEFVCSTMRHAPFDAAAREPRGKALGMVVAACALRAGGATE